MNLNKFSGFAFQSKEIECLQFLSCRISAVMFLFFLLAVISVFQIQFCTGLGLSGHNDTNQTHTNTNNVIDIRSHLNTNTSEISKIEPLDLKRSGSAVLSNNLTTDLVISELGNMTPNQIQKYPLKYLSDNDLVIVFSGLTLPNLINVLENIPNLQEVLNKLPPKNLQEILYKMSLSNS